MNESSWIMVAQLPLSVNLALFSQQLHERGVIHQIIVSGTTQAVWIENPDYLLVVKQLLLAYQVDRSSDPWAIAARHPKATKQPAVSDGKGRPANKFSTLCHSFPIVISSLILSTLGWFLILLDFRFNWQLRNYLFFASPVDIVTHLQFWRLITPIFLHFSEMHLIFNGLWLWVFGTRIEARLGSVGLLNIILMSALLSNFTQFMWHSSSPFGGMSGVVYGLLGYLWMRAKYDPDPRLILPPALMGMMVFFLILGMSGGLDVFTGGGGIANGAHLGGLLAGIVMGYFAGIKYKKSSASQ